MYYLLDLCLSAQKSRLVLCKHHSLGGLHLSVDNLIVFAAAALLWPEGKACDRKAKVAGRPELRHGKVRRLSF